MKKKLITITIISILIVLSIGYNYSTQETQGNSLLMENVEAMAGSEGGDHSKDQPLIIQCNTPYLDKACTTTVITCQGGGSGCSPRPCSIHG